MIDLDKNLLHEMNEKTLMKKWFESVNLTGYSERPLGHPTDSFAAIEP